MKNRLEIALKKFKENYNCAQAVLFAFCDDINMDEDTALRLSTGFGAGMGRKQEVCGAISGGILVLGAKYGRGENEKRKVAEQCYEKTHALIEKFQERHGTYSCRDLLDGCELNTKAGRLYYKSKGLRKQKCDPCVQSVIEALEELL